MTTCDKCQDKTCLKTKKPCQKIEDILRKEGAYSIDYIRPRFKHGSRWREIPFSSMSKKWQEAQGLIDPKEN